MNSHFITFGTYEYRRSVKRILGEARATGWFQTIQSYSHWSLNLADRISLRHVLKQKRGGGFWLWKPLILMNAINRIPDGDFLVYCDAGCVVNSYGARRWEEYKSLAADSPSGILNFQTGFREEKYTGERVFEHFHIDRESPIRTTGQFEATILVIRKCVPAKDIFKQFAETARSNPLLFTDAISTYDPYQLSPTVRHDQSIFSVICKEANSFALPAESWAQDWDDISHVPFQGRRMRQIMPSLFDRLKYRWSTRHK
jgi:hypothetical protein